MLQLITSLIKNPSKFKPDLHLINSSLIKNIMGNENKLAGDKEKIEKIRRSKIWIFDKDDTLVPLHEFQVNDEKIAEMLIDLLQKKKDIFIASNSVVGSKKSIKSVIIDQKQRNVQLQILQISQKKPYNGPEILQRLKIIRPDIKPEEITIVGDRLMTDIYLGNTMGWNTIYVDPIEKSTLKKHGLGVTIMRMIQKKYLSYL